LREVIQTWFAVTAVLLFILLTNQFAKVLGKAATGELPRDAVLMLLGLTSLQYLTVLVPVALLLAIMLGLGRMYRDSEMTAMLACGIGPVHLYRPLILLASVLAMIIGWLAMVVTPWSIRTAEIMRYSVQESVEFGSLEAGRFHTDRGNRTVFFAGGVADDGMLENVFIQRRNGDSLEVSVAQGGRLTPADENGWRTMLLYQGRRYSGVPGTLQFDMMEFAEEGIPIRPVTGLVDLSSPEMLSFTDLVSSNDPMLAAEFQWRLSAPISIFVLTFLAVPLARTGPREGRYGKILIAILVYIFYTNILGSGKAWLENGRVPTELGLLWVHGLMVIFAGLLLMLHGRVFHRIFLGRVRPRAGA
jgi:lipopolysaccharide export system permease protein